MSKVKHFLRRLHIGDHNHHGRPPSQDPSPQSSSSQPSPSFDLPQTSLSSENENSTSDGGFNFFEEEFELQLALAISVSDQGRSGVDSETAQIDAAKKISLGRTPSQNLGEFLSLRYWCHDVLNYDEKVFDGFYDVCGMNSKSDSRSRIPSLQELKAASLLDDIGQEVVLVNRSSDVDLRKLEERVYLMSLECCGLDKTLNTSLLVQRIADLIVDKMGGPVVDVEDMFRRWRIRNKELRIHLNTVILPLGSLDIGHSRQRALLFKVLADRINLPCKLVKGSYYTGTDEGAVNLVKLDDGSEYIIDLMGAPGSLIPSEVPSPPPVNASDTSTIMWNEMSSSIPSDMGGTKSFLPDVDEFPKVEVSQFLPAKIGSNVTTSRTLLKTQTEQLSHEYEVSINGGKRKWLESTSYFGSDEPVLNGESHTALLDKCIASSDTRPYDFKVDELVGKNSLDGRGILSDQRHDSQDEYSRLPLNGIQTSDTAYIRNREFSDEPLRENLFNMWDGANALSSSVLREQNLPVTSVNDFDAAGSRFADFSQTEQYVMLTPSDESACRVQNFQIDSMIDGVAEILWEDLRIGERIGIGSYGEVYRAEWNDTEVAVKKFMNQEISGDALAQFKCEVEIMLRLRHPNVVLFMGAVTRPPNMSILTEFLPRGSLYKLLHRPNILIDEKRRIKMALDVAKGMNYLHTSHPTIVHRDLKSPNLLVDKNWVVKVCDFGMSRLQHHTFLSSKSAAGTAEWMAPEVLRNEPSNEKSDVYSYGVILWELATLQVPWAGLNSMQVVGAVGFQGRHLEIPPTVDPTVTEIINDCWKTNTWDRPSFAQIIARLKSVQWLTLHPAKNCQGRL